MRGVLPKKTTPKTTMYINLWRP